MEAYRLRSVLGRINVARAQIEGVRSGVIKNPHPEQEIDSLLASAAEILQEECKLVDSGRTPTLRRVEGGKVAFDGTLSMLTGKP